MPELLLEMYKEQLDWGWITLNDLKQDVVSELLTTENYKQITGENYDEETSN
ncbi:MULTISPECIES: XkdX family protein [Lactobacillus]|uniref:XkdX family protein n=2 Tax=Lactobacillus TaxID=1578 RepID=A0A256LCB8_9LACO|nr:MULTISPECIES: XkdX family protein [Lactobacillus]MTE02768.1 XkdX family protein [Lactobacillus johnsonii]OYR87451.1 hypothetical protein CBF53_08415 [Lactobacillus taiwanensis]OYR91069.1 hypothetical protein CBF70_07850 [Lactobacillus taiwanensis]OYR92531.1 hypothetical protein CBF59_03640 [Lactobacillus taiwanensis]OYR94478.1 hypothetical protein CBF58_08625 [Lactobacillus taiwanensis]